MAAGSLVVRVSANINDFSRNMQRMTRDVNKAADTIAAIGQKMTLGITLPVGLAAIALAKMGAENEAVGRKMTRVFGAATEQVQANLDRLMQVIPETGTEMQKMAIALTETADDMGFGAKQAAAFAQGVMTMSGAISATKMVPFAEANAAVTKAMMGQTKGLKSLGIVMSESDIKQEAYRLGLAKVGQELTSQGTALAAYSLMMQRTAGMTKEVGAVQQDAATKLAFLKRDFLELADATSNLVVPALTLFVGGMRQLVDWLSATPTWLRETILLVAGLAAVMGPLIVVTTQLIKVFTALRAAVALLMAANGLAGLLALLANPVVLAALAAIAIALGVGAAAWKKYHKEANEKPIELPTPPSLKALMGSGAATATGTPSTTPLEEFRKRSQAAMQAFQQTADMGRQLPAIFDKIVALNAESLSLYDKQADKLGEMALAAQDVYNQTRALIAIQGVANSLYQPAGNLRQQIGSASRTVDSQQSISTNIAAQKIQYETSLRTREAMLRMTDTFDAVREAALSFGESLRQTAQDFSVAFTDFKSQWTNTGKAGEAAMGALKQSVTGLVKEFSIWGLILKIINDILSGIGPQIAAVLSPLKALGQMLGTVLAPVFRALYSVIQGVVIGLGWLGSTVLRVTGGIHVAFGKLFVGIGNALNKLPGSIGNPIKKMGEGFLKSAADHYKMADQLTRAYNELQGTSWEEAMNGVDSLGDAARRTAEELRNLPASFKYALRKFQATQAVEVDSSIFAAGSGGNQTSVPRSAPAGVTQVNLMLDGKVVSSVVLKNLRNSAQSQLGDSMRFPELSVI